MSPTRRVPSSRASRSRSPPDLSSSPASLESRTSRMSSSSVKHRVASVISADSVASAVSTGSAASADLRGLGDPYAVGGLGYPYAVGAVVVDLQDRELPAVDLDGVPGRRDPLQGGGQQARHRFVRPLGSGQADAGELVQP
ncbi:hypothetical protein SANTM175S_11027 [Streptomyces antimycoticus]